MPEEFQYSNKTDLRKGYVNEFRSRYALQTPLSIKIDKNDFVSTVYRRNGRKVDDYFIEYDSLQDLEIARAELAQGYEDNTLVDTPRSEALGGGSLEGLVRTIFNESDASEILHPMGEAAKIVEVEEIEYKEVDNDWEYASDWSFLNKEL